MIAEVRDLELDLIFNDYSTKNDIVEYSSIFKIVFPAETVNSANIILENGYWYDNDVSTALSFLKERYFEVLNFRLVDSFTLSDTGIKLGLTRERVRQIEDQAVKKFSTALPKKLIMELQGKITSNNVLFIDEIPIADSRTRLLFSEITSHKSFRGGFNYDKKLAAFIKDSSFSFFNIEKNVINFVLAIGQTICSEADFFSHLGFLYPSVKPKNILARLVENGIVSRIFNNQIFFHSIYKTKVSKIEFVYYQNKNGIETARQIDYIKNELDKYFPYAFNEDDKRRAIAGLVGNSDKIVLWEWGKQIHIKHVESIVDNFDFSNLLSWIDQHLETLLAVDLDGYYTQNEDLLKSIGIPSKYALHTMLKIKYPEDYGYQDSPRVASVGSARLELKEIVLSVMDTDKVFELDELVDLLKSPKIRVQQLLDRLEEVIAVDSYKYKSRKYIYIQSKLIQDIVDFANKKVAVLGYIYISLVVNNFREQLYVINQYDKETLLADLLHKENLDKNFNISNKRLVDKLFPITKNSLNFHYQLYQFMGDNIEISKNDVFDYFVTRGLEPNAVMSYFYYSGTRLISRVDKDLFVKNDHIGIDQKIVDEINILAEAHSSNEKPIEFFLEILDKEFQLRDGLKWNRYIFCDVLRKNNLKIIPNNDFPQFIVLKQ